MEIFVGIVVYEIVINGLTLTLNGTHTNNSNGGHLDSPFEVNNEIAKRKIEDSDSDRNLDILEGVYNFRYIDKNLVNGTLEIVIKNEAYEVTWSDDKGSILFTGIGLKAGGSHFAVSYQHVKWP